MLAMFLSSDGLFQQDNTATLHFSTYDIKLISGTVDFQNCCWSLFSQDLNSIEYI